MIPHRASPSDGRRKPGPIGNAGIVTADNDSNMNMNTLLHTTEGCSPMHELIDAECQPEVDDKFVRWEAIRNLCNTLGARDGLNAALRQQNPNQLNP